MKIFTTAQQYKSTKVQKKRYLKFFCALAIVFSCAFVSAAQALPLKTERSVYSDGLYENAFQAMPTEEQIERQMNLQSPKKEPNSKILREAKDLESVLISVMVEPMFPEGKESNLYGGKYASGVYRTMMIQEYGKILSETNGLGIAENIAKKLTN